MSDVKRVMSGMRTTGVLHLGNFWGSLKNWLELQHEYECYFGAMDWHAMTSAYKKTEDMRSYTREMIAEWVAWGLDPNKCTVFVQSQVPEHLTLFMVFANLTPMGWLERVTTWKDAEEEMKISDTRNLGRFAYPVLQTSDISIYEGALVPVGKDQVAHIEISREIVRRFNKLYKGKLPEPKPLLTPTPHLLGLDGRKMSKSYGNTIELTSESKTLKKKINKMLTDPKRVRREDPGEPTVCPVYSFHKLYSKEDDLAWVEAGCRSAGIGCGDCKARLFERVDTEMQIPREKKKELLNNPKQLDSIIGDGCHKARKVARETMEKVSHFMGLDLEPKVRS